ncbi:MAG TPA: hypothetical protein DEA82_08465 [Flavobacteriaceae bacterium]|nr:hypothetical protein [Flavobacteriaceae bacterium]|tara:strand:- start:825 stop:1778 length:954 start_codon:yes stop_codon:yes gene_type:complete
MKQDTDQDLIDKTLQGHSHAFGVLVERYQNFVFTIILRMVKQREAAEEIAQDSFVKAYEKLATFEGRSKFSSWLYSIAYRKALDYIKQQRRKVAHTDIEQLSDVAMDGVENGLQQLIAKEKKELIQQCIMQLSETNAALLTFYYFEDLSVREISEITELSEDNIKIRMFRGRKELYSLLAPHIKIPIYLMEKPYKKDEQTFRELMQMGGTEKPSKNFASKVMLAIQAEKEPVKATPLVSLKGWIVLVFIFVASSALLYYFPIENALFSKNMTQSFSNFNEMMSSLKMSKGMWYACVFLSLFLVQLPFLKRFLDKQRS